MFRRYEGFRINVKHRRFFQQLMTKMSYYGINLEKICHTYAIPTYFQHGTHQWRNFYVSSTDVFSSSYSNQFVEFFPSFPAYEIIKLSVHKFPHLLHQLTDYHKTWNAYYDTEGPRSAVSFIFLHSVTTVWRTRKRVKWTVRFRQQRNRNVRQHFI